MGYPHQGRKWPGDHVAPAAVARPAETADQHIERELLTAENQRLRDELKRAEHALKVAAKVLGPYLTKNR